MAQEEKIIYKLEFQSGALDQELDKINKEMTKLNKSQKLLKDTNKQSSKEFSTQKQELKQLSAEYRVVSQAMSNTNKQRQKNVGYLESQKAKLSLVTAQINKLSEAELKNNKVGGQLLRTRKQLNDELTKYEAKGGTFYRNVGNYTAGMKALWGQLKLFFGITAIITLFRNMFNTIKEFDQASARLASVLGETKEEISDLTDLSRELGATTQYTATQVLSLAEALARLGFSKQEIKDMTKDVLNLATALDTELSDAATLAGSTIRAFGLTTKDSSHVMDVLSKSTTESSLSFEKLKTGLPIVGTTAKNAGVSLEKLVATLGTLTDRGIDASMAATSLRKIYLQLAKSGMSMEEAYDKINKATDKNKVSMELFGVRAATAGVILSDSKDAVDEFTASLILSDGVTKEMAETQLDTLQGSLLLLKSAWDGFILSMNESSGVGEKLKNVFKYLAENFVDVMKTLAIITAGFIAYKTTMIAMSVATEIYTKVTKLAKAATVSFNTAMKATPWGAIVSGIAMLITYLALYGKETKKAKDYTKDFNDELAKETSQLNANFDILNKTKEGTKERSAAIKTINELYGSYLPNLLTEKSTLIEIAEAQKIATDAIYDNILMKLKQEEVTTIMTQAMTTQLGILRNQGAAMTANQTDVFKAMAENLSEFKKGSKDYNNALGDMLQNSYVFQSVSTSAFTKYTASIKSMKDELKEVDKVFGSLAKTSGIDVAGGDPNDDANADAKAKASDRAYKQAVVDLEKYRLLYQEELGKRTELYLAQRDELLAIKQEELDYEINIISEKYKLDAAKLKESLDAKKITEAKYLQDKYFLEQNYQIQKEKLLFKYEDEEKKVMEDSNKFRITQLDKQQQLDKAYAKQKLIEGKISQTKYSEELVEIEIRIMREKISQELVDEAQKQILLQKIREKSLELSALREYNIKQKSYKKMLKDGIISNNEYYRKMADLEVFYLKKSTDYALANEETKQKMIAEIREKWNKETSDAVLGITKEEHLQELQELYAMGIELAQQYVDYLADIQADADQRELDLLLEKHEKINEENDLQHNQELLKLEAKFKSGEISEEQYYKQRLTMEGSFNKQQKKLAEAQEKEEQAQREQALEAQKKYQIASVMINAASAIISAWANTIPYPAGAIYAAAQSVIIGASAAMQVSQINSQHLAGGGVLDGPSHMSGGINIGTSEVEGGEYIINRASTQQYLPLLDYINESGNATGNSANVKEIINYGLMAQELGKVINDKKVILTQDDLVDEENDRVIISNNVTF